MFGFPDHISEYGLREYIRLIIFICGYLVFRPYIERFYKRMWEKDRERQLKKEQEEAARKHKEQRVKERLGIKSTEPLAEDASSSATQPKKSVSNMFKRKTKTEKDKRQAVLDDFMSDEDVTDLIMAKDEESVNL